MIASEIIQNKNVVPFMKHNSKPTTAIWSHQLYTPQFSQEASQLNTSL